MLQDEWEAKDLTADHRVSGKQLHGNCGNLPQLQINTYCNSSVKVSTTCL